MSENPYPEHQPGGYQSGGGYLPGGYQPHGTSQSQGPTGSTLPSGAPNPYGNLPSPSQPSISAMVLTGVSAMLTLSVYCACIGLPPLIFGIMALVKQSQDPAGASRLAKIGWVVLVLMTVLTIASVVVAFAVYDVGDPTPTSSYPTY